VPASTVVNVGTGVTAEQFVAAVTEHSATVIGMSDLLTTTIPRMSETIALLEEGGIRKRVEVGTSA
jgi:5-methyltetrahydrofolate--homocysteine methyltransferase